LLTNEQWEIVKKIGSGKYSEGVRKMSRLIDAQAKRRLQSAAMVLSCEADCNSLMETLRRRYPELETGRKKTADLVAEIMLGESRLEHDHEQQTIVRVVSVSSVSIVHPSEPSKYLVELRQEWGDRIVERGLEGISEKVLGGESPVEAAIRGVKEELGISLAFIKHGRESLEANQKSAYKGIQSFSCVQSFSATIAQSDYQNEYREIQEAKTTVFGWREV
jgi:hypothetical protein